MMPPCSSSDQDAVAFSLDLSTNVTQHPMPQIRPSAIHTMQHQPGPQPSPQSGGVHQLGAIHGEMEAGPVAEAADQNLQFPGDNTGGLDDVEAQEDVVDLTLVPNQLDPVWQLRFYAAATLFSATMTALTLPRNLPAVHSTYERAMLIASVGVPIGFAALSLLASFRLPSDPVGRSNWIKILSCLNIFMIGGHVFYWAIPR